MGMWEMGSPPVRPPPSGNGESATASAATFERCDAIEQRCLTVAQSIQMP
jgi:hypothetical protein